MRCDGGGLRDETVVVGRGSKYRVGIQDNGCNKLKGSGEKSAGGGGGAGTGGWRVAGVVSA